MRRFFPHYSARHTAIMLSVHQGAVITSSMTGCNHHGAMRRGGAPQRSVSCQNFTVSHRLFSTSSRVFAPDAPQQGTPKEGSGSPSMGKGNYFAFFDFPVDPTLDVGVLQKRYHALQKQFHPDQRQQQEEVEPSAAPLCGSTGARSDGESSVPPSSSEMDAVSTYANEAYSVLKDPFLRCRYLNKWRRATEKKVKGNEGSTALTVEEEEALAVDDDVTLKDKENDVLDDLDEEFLMEMMVMNELIFTGDRTQEMIRNQLLVLKADLKERNEDQFELAKECWADKDWRGFTACIHKWTYTWNAWNNLIDRL